MRQLNDRYGKHPSDYEREEADEARHEREERAIDEADEKRDRKKSDTRRS